jgi:citrate lyase subunit beta/citryl-CoA lyase
MSGGSRRRRSVLFAPGHRRDLLAKMSRCAPDCVVLDLEDGTPAEHKADARGIVANALREVWFGDAERIVRINAMSSEHAAEDLRWLRAETVGVDAVLLPKVDGVGDIERFERDTGGRRWPLWILPTETALGFAHLSASVTHPTVTGVIWAAEDFAADIGAAGSRQADGDLREVFRVARAHTLLTAKAAGVDAIDTTYVDLGDLDGLRREAEHCRRMGFDGKAAIHPSHIEVINEVYTPPEEDVAYAERLVAAFRAANGGAIRFEGRMVDAPHYRQALRVLTRAGQGEIDA